MSELNRPGDAMFFTLTKATNRSSLCILIFMSGILGLADLKKQSKRSLSNNIDQDIEANTTPNEEKKHELTHTSRNKVNYNGNYEAANWYWVSRIGFFH